MKKVSGKSLKIIFISVLFTLICSYSRIMMEASEIDTNNIEDSLHVHFFNMENGDCTFIKYGDIEILVDFGENSGKVSTVKKKLRDEITDGILEYVFVTHGDSDHIRNSIEVLSLFDRESADCEKKEDNVYYRIDTLIDFDTDTVDQMYTSNIYKNYIKKRCNMIKSKSINNYVSVDKYDNWNNEYLNDKDNIDQYKTVYIEKNFSISVIYNKFYFEKPNNPNNGSVCLLLEYYDSKVLLTGDLEKEGERELLNNDLLKNVTLFKAGHHGSNTSNSEEFIDHIKPQYVMISCCAGYSKENFPNQESLDNFLKYTDYIYISSYYSESAKQKADYHGNVTFEIDDKRNVEVTCDNKDSSETNGLNLYSIDENSNKKLNPITETTWFKENRISEISVYVFSGYEDDNNAFLGNCTLIKYGHYDILIDCGNYGTVGKGAYSTSNYIEDVEEYCVDGIIEYLIVTSPMVYSISQLVDIKIGFDKTRQGLLSKFDVECLIDFGDSFDPSNGSDNSLFSKYTEKRKELVNNGTIHISVTEFSEFDNSNVVSICDMLEINILNNEFYGDKGKNKFDSSISCTVDYCGNRLLFLGNITNDGEKHIVETNDLSNVIFFVANDFAYQGTNINQLLDEINDDDLYIAINCIDNEYLFGKEMLNDETEYRLLNNANEVLVTCAYNEDDRNYIGSDIIFKLDSNGLCYFEYDGKQK